MPLDVRLLGRPRLAAPRGAADLAGHKTWGLLALLLLRSTPPSRDELLELLWPEPDDPAGALRWTLARVRRAVRPAAEIRRDDSGRLVLTGRDRLRVDALRLLDGTFEVDEIEGLTAGELLDGLSFADAPLFEDWLALERIRVASAARAGLRWAATMLAEDDPRRAIDHLARATALDPFDDAAHELAVEIRVASGQRLAAVAYADGVERLYRRELGTTAPTTLRRPLDRRVRIPANPLVDFGVSARALLDVAQARFDAGDYDGAIDAARRASADAAASHEHGLEAQAGALLASVLIHSIRGRDREAVALLERSLRLAHLAGYVPLASEILREVGYVAFLEADYGAAEATLGRSLQLARATGDPRLVGRALTILGASQSDRGDHDGALATLGDALTQLEAAGDARWHAYASSFLARVLGEIGAHDEARQMAARAASEARSSGWLALVPFPLTIGADAALAAGDGAESAALSGEAYTLAVDMGDPCWEALSLRGLARCRRANGDHAEAVRLLVSARDRSSEHPDTYAWAVAQILIDLAEAQDGSDRDPVERARQLAERGPIPAVMARLDRLGGGARPTRGRAGARRARP